jgi:hypothetical protein
MSEICEEEALIAWDNLGYSYKGPGSSDPPPCYPATDAKGNSKGEALHTLARVAMPTIVSQRLPYLSPSAPSQFPGQMREMHRDLQKRASEYKRQSKVQCQGDSRACRE